MQTILSLRGLTSRFWTAANSRLLSRRDLAGLVALTFLITASPVSGQAPGLLWSTNVGGTLFAVDAQANAYAYAGSNVIKISSTGQPLETNSICPLPGVARRDADGNYYFAGSFDGWQDFGGVSLLGGCTNCGFGQWAPGWPSGYLAKYNNAGSLLWVVRFGPNGPANEVDDLLLDVDGTCYVGYRSSGQAALARFGDQGTNIWNQTVDFFPGESMAITLGGLTASNCAYIAYRYVGYVVAGRVDQAGNRSGLGQYPLQWRSLASTNGRPVVDNLGRHVLVGQCFDPINDPECEAQHLRKFGTDSSTTWSQVITADAHWTLQSDAQANVYVAGPNGMFAKYDDSGSLVWSNNFSMQAIGMVVDGAGNRFLSFSNGTVARMANEAGAKPAVVGSRYSSAGFTFVVQGDTPAYRIWTNSILGEWSEAAIITNSGGSAPFVDPSATSAPMRFYRVEPLP